MHFVGFVFVRGTLASMTRVGRLEIRGSRDSVDAKHMNIVLCMVRTADIVLYETGSWMYDA